MNQHCYDLAIRVLISQEDGEVVAHALELDLLAYGATEKEAVKELQETMFAQLSFAAQKERPEMVNHPAPREFFKRWDEANRSALEGAICPDKAATLKTKAIFIQISPQKLKAARESGTSFERIPERALAAA